MSEADEPIDEEPPRGPSSGDEEALAADALEPIDADEEDQEAAIAELLAEIDGELVEAANEETSALVAMTAERDEYLDALRRLQAEFDNYRKRVARQQEEMGGRATEALLERLLPLLDALDLAIAHSRREGIQASELGDALAQIGALTRDTLAKEGLERIDESELPFDPNRHDAVAHVERAEGEEGEGTVIDEILRAGYQLKGRVLRPAMVRVRG